MKFFQSMFYCNFLLMLWYSMFYRVFLSRTLFPLVWLETEKSWIKTLPLEPGNRNNLGNLPPRLRGLKKINRRCFIRGNDLFVHCEVAFVGVVCCALVHWVCASVIDKRIKSNCCRLIVQNVFLRIASNFAWISTHVLLYTKQAIMKEIHFF